MKIDRVLVRTCKEVEGWGRDCVMPKVKKTCSHTQLINAVVTGLITPILAWIAVYLVYKLAAPRESRSDLKPEGEHSPKCAPKMVLILGFVGLLGSAASA